MKMRNEMHTQNVCILLIAIREKFAVELLLSLEHCFSLSKHTVHIIM